LGIHGVAYFEGLAAPFFADLRHVRFLEVELGDEGVPLEIVSDTVRICTHGFHGVLKLGWRAALRQRNLPQLREIVPILGARNTGAW
jgi:hypothetical protein